MKNLKKIIASVFCLSLLCTPFSVSSADDTAKYGDLNSDGAVDLTDMTCLSLHLLGDMELDDVDLDDEWSEASFDSEENEEEFESQYFLTTNGKKYVTDKAYENPVFVEDLVRNVAVATERYNAFSWYRIEAENFESIHNHSAYACVERTLG